jgi:dimethylargininase
MRLAITREISPSMNRCELTHLARQPIDLDLARAQHAEYERCLRVLGCTVQRLPAAPDFPDSVFVEDCAVVLDEVAVIARPGALSRRGEIRAIVEALAPLRRLVHLEAPAALDGGDVLRVGRTLFVGVSSRTTGAGIEQLRRLIGPFGYSVVAVEVRGCLHLKSAATGIAPRTLLVNGAWIPDDAFAGFDRIEVDPREPSAANAVRIGDDLVCSAAFPLTRERLESHGFRVHAVDVSEIAKAEGAVTCCSLIVEDPQIRADWTEPQIHADSRR